MNTLKQEVAYFMRRLYRQQLTTSSGGNISAKQNLTVFITPSGIDKGRIQSSQIGAIDTEGKVIESAFKLSMETPMHLAIYKARPDIKAIVHAHPTYATAYASATANIDSNLTSEGRLVLGPISKAKYALMGSEKLAELVAEKAKNSHVILMENHGVIALGKTLLEAFDRLEVMEFTAKMNYIAQSLKMQNYLSQEQMDEIDKMNL